MTERLIISVNADCNDQLIIVDLDTGKKKISIGLNVEEAQQFSILLSEAVTTLMLSNMRAYENQQSRPKH